MATNAKNLAELLNTDTTVAVGDVANGSINADKIADNAITALKLNITGDGTSGQFLKTDGDGSFSYINAPTVTPPTQQRFTSSGTWTRPTNCKTVKVIVIGGGGGSGGVRSGTAELYNSSGSGGGGGTSIKLIDVSSIASVTVTIGAGGTAGAGGTPTSGGTGGTSSFGSYATATGGSGGFGGGRTDGQAGTLFGDSGEGGTAASGDLNLRGEAGVHTRSSSTQTRQAGSPVGSDTLNYHSGPRGGMAAGLSAGNTANTVQAGPTTSQTGAAGEANTGNGGQGSAIRHSNSSASGAVGGTGIVIVDEFYG